MSKETIKKMGFSPHNLWIVKMDEEVFGPYESESLKHYASEHEELFDEALATRLGQHDWRPFYSHPLFQRRNPQALNSPSPNQEGPYWVLGQGQKLGPFSKQEIEKRIELGSIGFTDLVSVDDGHNWHKLYHMENFERRFLSSSGPPFAPLDSQFQKARLELLETIDNHTSSTKLSEELAEMAYHLQNKSKVLSFRTEDAPLRPVNGPAVSEKLKWGFPVAFTALLAIFIGVRFMISDDETEKHPANEIAAVKTKAPRPNEYNIPAPPKERPTVEARQMPVRKPASAAPYKHPLQHTPPPYTPPQYNSYTETHNNDYPPPENDPYGNQDPQVEENREPASEHSLVGNQHQEDPQSLDDAMGGNPPVEEVSDF